MMLLNDQHEDDKNQLGRQEKLEEKGLRNTNATVERSRGIEPAAGHEAVGKTSSGHTTKQLGDDNDNKADEVNATGGEHGNGDGGVEHAASDAEESPVEKQCQPCSGSKISPSRWAGSGGAYQTLTIRDIPKAKEM